jgi:hypothetical protein
MRDKEPMFTVTDRRKFTSDGELREGYSPASETITPPAPPPQLVAEPAKMPPAPEIVTGNSTVLSPEAVEPMGDESLDASLMDEEENLPEPSAAESAQQTKEYHASAHRLDDMLRKANPGQALPPAMNFDRLVQSLYMSAAMQMGAGTPPNEQPRIDIVGARQSIDMLTVLEEKTRGNVNEQEKRLLQNALFDLRMSFLEITNAIASSAQRPPKAGKIH